MAYPANEKIMTLDKKVATTTQVEPPLIQLKGIG